MKRLAFNDTEIQDALTGENDKKEVEEFFIPFFKAAFRVMKKKIIHPLHGYHLWSAGGSAGSDCVGE